MAYFPNQRRTVTVRFRSIEADAVPAAILGGVAKLVGAVEHGAAVRLPGGSTAMADAVRALDEAGVRFAEVDLTEPSLDDVFLASTGRHLGAGDDVPT